MSSRYEDLKVWQGAMDLAKYVYQSTQAMPESERYGLIAQMRRSAVSVASNIAEGQGRLTSGEFKQFLGNARGSLFELQTQIRLARDLGFIETAAAQPLLATTENVRGMLTGLIQSLGPASTRNSKLETRNRGT